MSDELDKIDYVLKKKYFLELGMLSDYISLCQRLIGYIADVKHTMTIEVFDSFNKFIEENKIMLEEVIDYEVFQKLKDILYFVPTTPFSFDNKKTIFNEVETKVREIVDYLYLDEDTIYH